MENWAHRLEKALYETVLRRVKIQDILMALSKHAVHYGARAALSSSENFFMRYGRRCQ
ncbi:MAG: hypothetical protein LBK73_01610 [Treponema sp.]|nr:hypothetical protein [Treponema sp.]